MGQTLIPVLWLSTDGAYVAAVVSADAFLFSQGCGSVCAAPTLGRGQKLQHQSLCFIFLLVRSQHHSTKVDGKHQMCDTHVSSMCRMDAGAAPGRKQHMLPPGAQSSAPVLTSCSSWLHLTLRSPCSLLQPKAHPRTKTRLLPPGGRCASHMQLSIGCSCWAAAQDTSPMLLNRLS